MKRARAKRHGRSSVRDSVLSVLAEFAPFSMQQVMMRYAEEHVFEGGNENKYVAKFMHAA